MMIHAEPFLIMAARVFIDNRADSETVLSLEEQSMWYTNVVSQVSNLNPEAVDPLLNQAYSETLRSSRKLFRSQNMGCDNLRKLLYSIISLLFYMMQWDASHLVCSKDQIQVLYEGLRFCRSLLRQRPRLFDNKVCDQIAVLICDAGVFICSLQLANVESQGQLSNLLECLHAIREGVKNCPSEASVSMVSKTNMLNISHVDNKDNNIVHLQNRIWSHQLPDSNSTLRNGVVGLDGDITSIIDRLVCGSESLRVVAICGMAGIGKTTLASKVFNHPSLIHRFHARGWCTISQVLDKKKVLAELLNQIRSSTESYSNLETEDDLANCLRRRLKGKRYLIFLDDVWTAEAWKSLEMSFPNDSTQSRIILTSRHYSVAPRGMLDQEPHSLCLRQDYQSLEIMQMRLFPGKVWPLELMDLGMQIAEMCKGLPLTVMVVTGLLETTEQHGWKGILRAMSTCGVSSEEQCNIALELSYQHLPQELKHCLLYFGVFPDDENVSVNKLIRLWIAENFVMNIESKKMEDVARDYLNNLIQRSLVVVAENRSLGGVKTCQIHDLLHDFCRRKAEEENFYHLLQGMDQLSDSTELWNLQRLCIHTKAVNLKRSNISCPSAHSLLFFSPQDYLLHMSFIIQIFKLVKVLDIGQIVLYNGLPSEIGRLSLLRYLSFQTRVGVLPSSLGNLSDLETLIVSESPSEMTLPQTFWNLQKLKYLDIGRSCVLPLDDDVENSELETLGCIAYYFDGSMEKRMRKFPSICKLECVIRNDEETPQFKKIVVLDFLSLLESLTITGYSVSSPFADMVCEFALPDCLRKMTLSGPFILSKREVSVIGKLPKLEVLKLQGMRFPRDTLEMEEEEFSALRYLKLSELSIRSWTASYELPCLQKLILDRCRELSEIPSCLELSDIREVDVRGCSSSLESLVRNIEKVQMDYGNPVTVSITDTYTP